MSEAVNEAINVIFSHISYGMVQDNDHDAVRRKNPLPQQGWPPEVSQGFRLGHRCYHETHGEKMIAEITRLRAEVEALRKRFASADYRRRAMTQIAMGWSVENTELDAAILGEPVRSFEDSQNVGQVLKDAFFTNPDGEA